MTPREFAREMDAARERTKREHQRDLFIAWQTAAFVPSALVGKMPDFRTVLARVEGRKDQTFEEMKAHLMTLSQLTGFPLVKH